MRERSLGLRKVDELFMTGEERADEQRERVMDIPITQIDDFPDHPFRVVNDDSMQEMVESVKHQGVLVPAIVRKTGNERFELVSGHRRKMACQLAGMDTMPAIVRELDRDTATLIMVDSNLQREVILPSEKAFSYKMRLEAMNRQSGRPSKENLTPVVSEKRSNEKLGEIVGESREQIRRYIRLQELDRYTYRFQRRSFRLQGHIQRRSDREQVWQQSDHFHSFGNQRNSADSVSMLSYF